MIKNIRNYGNNLTNCLEYIIENLSKVYIPKFDLPNDEIDYLGNLINIYRKSDVKKEDLISGQISARLIRLARQNYEVRWIIPHVRFYIDLKKDIKLAAFL